MNEEDRQNSMSASSLSPYCFQLFLNFSPSEFFFTYVGVSSRYVLGDVLHFETAKSLIINFKMLLQKTVKIRKEWFAKLDTALNSSPIFKESYEKK